MWTFVEAIFGFLVARLLWDYIHTMAKRQNMLPITWFLQVVGGLVFFTAFGCALIWCFAVIFTRGH